VAAAQIAQDFGNGSVRSGVGTSAMVLGWFAFALFIIVTIGLLVMILSIHLLDRLTDEWEANGQCDLETWAWRSFELRETGGKIHSLQAVDNTVRAATAWTPVTFLNSTLPP
jgi:hypothetical protein